MQINCCMDCPDRAVGCHGKCQKYLEAKAEIDRKAKQRERIKKGEKDADDYNISRSIALKQRYRRKPK